MSFNQTTFRQGPNDIFAKQQIGGQVSKSDIMKAIYNVVWWSPADGNFYQAEDVNASGPNPERDALIARGADYFQSKKELRAAAVMGYEMGSTDVDRARYRGITDEFLPLAVDWATDWAKVDRGEMRAHGIITMKDYAPMKNLVVSAESIYLRDDRFVLDKVAEAENTEFIQEDWFDQTPYKATGGLGENDVTEPVALDYVTGNVKLKKIQVRVEWSNYQSMQNRYRDPVKDNRAILDKDVPRLINLDLSQVLTGFVNNASVGAYDVIGGTAFHHTNKPTRDFIDTETNVQTAGGQVDLMIMNGLTFQTLIENTWMREGGILAAAGKYEGLSPRIVTLEKLPGTTIAIEKRSLIADGTIFFLAQTSFRKYNGPRRSVTYDKVVENLSGQLLDVWHGSVIRVNSWGEEITGTVT